MGCEEVTKAFPDIKPPKTVSSGRFEGVFPILMRRFSEKGGDSKILNEYFDYEVCSDCNGERLGVLSRYVTVNNTYLPELSLLSLDELYSWIEKLEESLIEKKPWFS